MKSNPVDFVAEAVCANIVLKQPALVPVVV